MSHIKERVFTNKSDTNKALLEDCINILSKNTPTSMLLSGGSSPKEFYKLFSKAKLNWQNIYLSLTDERWVDINDDNSNEKLIKETLLQNEAQKAKFIGLKSAGDINNNGWQETEEKLKIIPQPFDIVLLGMGDDGHTASLFPDSDDTKQALDMNCPYLTMPITRKNQDIARITMTLKTLLNTKEIKLLFFGEKKWQIYKQAQKQKTDKYPVSYILNQTKTPVSIYFSE